MLYSRDKASNGYLEEHEQRWDIYKDVRSLFYPLTSILVTIELNSLISKTYDARGLSFIVAAFVYISYILLVSNCISLFYFLLDRCVRKGILSKNQERRFCLLCATSYFIVLFYSILASYYVKQIDCMEFAFFYPIFLSCLGLPHLITLVSVFFSGIAILSWHNYEQQMDIIIILLIYFGLILHASVNEFFLIKQRHHSSHNFDKSNSSEISIGVHYSTKILDEIIRNIKDGYELYSKVLLDNECMTEQEWSDDSTMASMYIARKFCSSLFAVCAPINVMKNDDLNIICRPSQFTFSTMLHKIFRIFECEQGSSLQLYFDDNCPEIFLKTSYEIFENFIFLLLFAMIHQRSDKSVILHINTAQENASYRINIVCIQLDRKSDTSLKQSFTNIIPSSTPLNTDTANNLNANKVNDLAYHLAERYLNLKIEGLYHEQKLGLLSNRVSFILPKDIVSTIDNTSSYLYSQLKVRHRWLIITSYNDSENKNVEWHSTLTPILNAMHIPTIFCDIKHLCKTSEKYVVALIHESILRKYPFQFSSTIQDSARSVIIVDDISHSVYEINQLYRIEPLTVLPSHMTVDSVTKCLKLIDSSQSPREKNGKSSPTDTDSLPLVNVYFEESQSNNEIRRKQLSSSSQKKKISFLKLNDVFLPRLLDLVLNFEKLKIVQSNYFRKATVDAILDGIKIRLNKFKIGEMNLHVDDELFSQTDYENLCVDLLISERLNTTKVCETYTKKINYTQSSLISFPINKNEEIPSNANEFSFSDDLSSNADTKLHCISENNETKDSNGQESDPIQNTLKEENIYRAPKILEILDSRHKKAKFVCSEYIPVIKSLRLHLHNKSFYKLELLASMASLRSAKYSFLRLSVYFATLQDIINILLMFCDNRDDDTNGLLTGQIFDDEVVDFILSTLDVIEAVVLDVIVYDS